MGWAGLGKSGGGGEGEGESGRSLIAAAVVLLMTIITSSSAAAAAAKLPARQIAYSAATVSQAINQRTMCLCVHVNRQELRYRKQIARQLHKH